MVRNLNKQQGFVLVVSLVFLIVLTGVASALMLNITSDMKMSGASQEKVIATQEAISSIDEVILIQTLSGENLFSSSALPEQGVSVDVTRKSTQAIITNSNVGGLVAECPHSATASSVDMFNCNILKISVTKVYGNNDTSAVVVSAGIAQQLLSVGE
jgi:Tfp pilus assembly protein PilX|tara:strand:- start:5877 stop:6347 length:471 start_codon:yes stop_codon:yes gene_type:complete